MNARNERGRVAAITHVLTVVALTLVGCRSAVPLPTDSAPANVDPNLEQFGRLVGTWHIEQQVLQADDSWKATEPAEWQFHYALGGHAVQDIWIQPPSSQPLSPGEVRQYGTNLRIYDPESDSWRIVWASNDSPAFTTYTARANPDGEMTMIGPDPERPGVTQRITYFDITEDGWSWKMEFSTDGEKWLEVARIAATQLR